MLISLSERILLAAKELHSSLKRSSAHANFVLVMKVTWKEVQKERKKKIR